MLLALVQVQLISLFDSNFGKEQSVAHEKVLLFFLGMHFFVSKINNQSSNFT
jgi:hypothetical protein